MHTPFVSPQFRNQAYAARNPLPRPPPPTSPQESAMTHDYNPASILSLISSALLLVYSMLENVIRRVRRLLLSGYYVVSEDWPAGNFRRWHSGTTLRSRFRLSDGGLALAFIRPFQPSLNPLWECRLIPPPPICVCTIAELGVLLTPPPPR